MQGAGGTGTEEAKERPWSRSRVERLGSRRDTGGRGHRRRDGEGAVIPRLKTVGVDVAGRGIAESVKAGSSETGAADGGSPGTGTAGDGAIDETALQKSAGGLQKVAREGWRALGIGVAGIEAVIATADGEEASFLT